MPQMHQVITEQTTTNMKTLKEIRTLRGMTQKELADKMEDYQPNVARIERGAIPLGANISTIMRINKALNCRAIIDRNKIFFEEIT